MYRLLIVDDEPYILEGVQRLINWKKYGFTRIETAQSYHEAVEKALECRPHVALFDICINETKGYDIIEQLNGLGLPTKYMMMSGYDEFEYARKSLSVGARAYLLKPIDRNELIKAVERVITEDLRGSLPNSSEKNENTDPVCGLRYEDLSTLTNKVLLIVKGEYGKNLTLRIVAEKFKMNSTYLGQIFLKETKMKFSEYLMTYRLSVAKEQIETTGDKISVIAGRVGYTNMNYFYLHFKEFYGFSPSSLRQTEKLKEAK